LLSLPGIPEVAILARPFAQLRNPAICSPISFDSGTNPVSTSVRLDEHPDSVEFTGVLLSSG
jgi:hypothetical protein